MSPSTSADPPNQPLRVAVCGTGYFSQFHYEAWARLPVDVVACCSLDADAADRIAQTYDIPRRFHDFARMLRETKPDLVDIITPPATHVELVSKSVELEVPTICQKPFADSLEDAKNLVANAEASNVPLIIHENFRFQPWHREIKSLIEKGALGQVYQVTFRLRPGDGKGPDAYLDRQPYFQKMQKFLVHETAIHFVDVFRFLLGEVDAVTAELDQLNPAISGEDAGVIVFKFLNGARAVFDGNRLSDHAAENRRLTMGEMEVEGERASVRLSGDGVIRMREFGANHWTRHDYPWTDHAFGGDCVYALQSHVIENLHSKPQALQNTARAYLQNLEIENAIYQSSTEGRRVRLPRNAQSHK